MIPYIEIPALPIYGELAIQPFGVLVVIAILVGQWMTRRRAMEIGIDDEEIVNGLMWCVGAGFVGAHWVEVIFYHPSKFYDEGPLVLLKIWDGLSSMGGIIGAYIGFTIFFRMKRKRWLPHAEATVQGLVTAWIFGRLGCTVVHDHPGHLTDFFLGVKYPDGVRHDLGLYEFLYTALVLMPANLILHRFKPPFGAHVALTMALYAPIRFLLDFLRTSGEMGSDPRYLGMTMAQYTKIGRAHV